MRLMSYAYLLLASYAFKKIDPEAAAKSSVK
jgi:hypothetical protein